MQRSCRAGGERGVVQHGAWCRSGTGLDGMPTGAEEGATLYCVSLVGSVGCSLCELCRDMLPHPPMLSSLRSRGALLLWWGRASGYIMLWLCRHSSNNTRVFCLSRSQIDLDVLFDHAYERHLEKHNTYPL